jgi:hypothetical protein
MLGNNIFVPFGDKRERTAMSFLARCKLGLDWPTIVVSCLLCLALVSLAGLPTLAQDLQYPKYRLQERSSPDRWEGLESLKISGEKIDLVAVLLTPATEAAGKGPDGSYHLGWYLPQAEPQMHIEVRDYRRFPNQYHYWMLPKPQQYTDGFQRLAWDATILKELRISLQDIGAVARVGGAYYSYPVVVPLLLSATPLSPPIRLQGCRFVFLPSETMTVDYRLYPKGNEGRVLFQGSTQQWDKEHKQTIAWRGQDLQGKPVSAGWYGLTVTATIAGPGKPQEPPLSLEWIFYYTPEIREER